MSHLSFDRPTLRPVLGILVIAGVVLLALLPNTGAIPASSTCSYGSCPSTAPATPISWYILLAVLIIVAVALGVLLLLRRRNPPTAAASVEPWSGPTAGAATGGATAGATDGATLPTDGGPAAAYIESDSDVAQPHPEVADAAAGAAAGGAAEGGGDIDSLMQELDKISGEILQRGKPKTPPANSEGSSDDGGEGSGQ
jgi:hypothetical protein